ncbi:right-handed parallel beta-helix repeat-containing protein [Arenicella xantha]|uniref:Parallel beta helix pectate lyase-like protein n=1 Tax=Arenicella xantha TaxID=644221 RepID=A0A395JNP4_9GAMM|nr:right-handed parallel beta-helix repeat-containing protein [Arenicella xantha]RBP52933.1 parallel beta helix pectate lyase-like protein [Arenicella xantha]
MQIINWALVAYAMTVAFSSASAAGSDPVDAGATALIVCVDASKFEHCDFTGGDAIQQAVDAAESGAVVHIKSGVYQPKSYRDTPLNELQIRGYTLIEDKQLTIIGEGEVVIDGSLSAANGFVTKNSQVSFKNLNLQNFKWGIQEDDIYDGHGIFIINGESKIADVSIQKVQKMALSVHGNAKVDVTNLTITDSHLGVWTNDDSNVSISNSEFSGSESAGLAAYQRSQVVIWQSVFQANQDDGLFASDDARVSVTQSVVLNNKPYGLNADENGAIEIDKSYVSGNDTDFVVDKVKRINVGATMLNADPRPFTAL